MEITTIPIGAIQPDPANVRTHNARNLEAIKASLARFGQQKPIVVGTGNEVIAGNGTLAAARALGWTTIRAIVTGLGRTEATAYAIADNRTAELAEWDDAALMAQLDALHADDPDLFEAAGFTAEELDQMVSDRQREIDDFDAQQDHDGDDQIPERPPAITKPGEVAELGDHKLICGDCVEAMGAMADNSIDAICTDPPYGIGFMGKGWDCSVPGPEFAAEALRVLKPGGHLIAFGGTRTIHRLTVALEDAGLEVRDQIGWLQWQGFPKSLDISKALDGAAGAARDVVGSKVAGIGTGDSYGKIVGIRKKTTTNRVDITAPKTTEAKQWAGWGTGLKPATEPAILCRKPLDGTAVENFQRWGVGGLNVDGCRIGYGDPAWPGPGDYDPEAKQRQRAAPNINFGGDQPGDTQQTFNPKGRWPANIYACPKPSRGEREAGCDELAQVKRTDVTGRKPGSAGQNHARSGMTRTGDIGNHHTTVKPIGLFRWLARLITPPGGVVLDPFLGSGTTMIAAEREGLRCVGIEREPEYCDIARARVSAAQR